jgi:hypothetical protein
MGKNQRQVYLKAIRARYRRVRGGHDKFSDFDFMVESNWPACG